MDKRKQGLTQGICLACAEFLKWYHEDTAVEEVLKGAGITVEEMQLAGVDEYDYDILKKFIESDYGKNSET